MALLNKALFSKTGSRGGWRCIIALLRCAFLLHDLANLLTFDFESLSCFPFLGCWKNSNGTYTHTCDLIILFVFIVLNLALFLSFYAIPIGGSVEPQTAATTSSSLHQRWRPWVIHTLFQAVWLMSTQVVHFLAKTGLSKELKGCSTWLVALMPLLSCSLW